MKSNQAIAQLERLIRDSKVAMRKGERKIADRIVNDAKSLAKGSLASKINVSQTPEETSITGGDDLSAYVEFGTGIYAKEYVSTLPPEAQAEAIKFFVTGEGRGHPQPFFFPSIFKHEQEIIPAVDEELQKLAK